MSGRLLVATRKGLFTVGEARGTWSVLDSAFLGDNVSMILPLPDGTVIAALDHGHFGVKLHRSRDSGTTWDIRPAPAFPPKPEDVEDLDPTRGTSIPWVVQRVWALERDHRTGTLWCGTIPGGLFRSFDEGDTWQLVESLWHEPKRKEWFGGGADLPGIHSVCLDPRRAERVVVGVSCGGVWVTEDDGRTWACRAHGMRANYMPPERAFDPHIQDPHRVVQCRAQPEVFWAAHHNGIFVSTDDVGSWTEVTTAKPSAFGFTVAVHPTDPDTAWFVPAMSDERRVPVDGRVVVSRTRDGGATFEVLDRGLPQSHAYDIAYRHALDIDASGSTLAFGTTTGSLWTSDDQGDSWIAVSTHLPPIYAVRFVDGE